MTLPVPYPADTRAKGWRFEIDYEKVEQSDTWDLAAEVPMAQHALLMMWLVSWTQVPCGSMPSDEAVIRAKCRIPQKAWSNLKPILMRGWWIAEDGRLYHDTIVERVREMLEYRRKEAERRNRNRGKTADVPRDTDGTDAVPTQDDTGAPDTGTGTSTTSLRSVASAPRATRKCPASFEVTPELQDWARREAPGVDLRRETDKFRDHTFKTSYSDWPGTWRNWIRRSAEGLSAKPVARGRHNAAAAAIFDMDTNEVINA